MAIKKKKSQQEDPEHGQLNDIKQGMCVLPE